MTLPDAVATFAAAQDGLVTRAQLQQHGVTRAAMRWRFGRGWTLVLPTVVSLRHERLSTRQRRIAALLEAGPNAVLSGEHACAWHGLRYTRTDGPVDVLVPMQHRARSLGLLRVHRTRRMDAAPVRQAGMVVASRVRAVIDSARWSRLAGMPLALVLEVAQRELVTIEQLEHGVEAGPTRGSAQARAAVRAARQGAWSVPEHALLQLCSTSRTLPSPWPNPRLAAPDGSTLLSPDLWFDDVGLAVMLHSRAHHSRDLDWEGTVERDGELAAHGIVVLAFTPSAIAREPAHVLGRIEQAHNTARTSGRRRPPVVMAPRGWGEMTA